MSKSLGNSLLVTEVVKRWRPVEVRYYLGAAHYRSNVEFSEAAWTRPRRPISASSGSSSAAARRLRRGGRWRIDHRPRCRPNSPPRWTTTWRCRARWPCCTRRCATATSSCRPPTTAAEVDRAGRARPRHDGGARARPAGVVGDARPISRRPSASWPTCCSSSAPRRGRARTSRRPTRSATSWPRPASLVEDTAGRSAVDSEGRTADGRQLEARRRGAQGQEGRHGRLGRPGQAGPGRARPDAAGRGAHRPPGRAAGQGGGQARRRRRPRGGGRGRGPLARAAAPARPRGAAELLVGRNPVAEALRADDPGDRALRRDRHRDRRAGHRGDQAGRRPRAWPCSRSAGPNSTG